MSLCAVGCILQTKLTSLCEHLAIPGSPRVTILLASPVWTLAHCVVKHSRPLDLKSSSNVNLPFAWITGPATDPSFSCKSNGIIYQSRNLVMIQDSLYCVDLTLGRTMWEYESWKSIQVFGSKLVWHSCEIRHTGIFHGWAVIFCWYLQKLHYENKLTKNIWPTDI